MGQEAAQRVHPFFEKARQPGEHPTAGQNATRDTHAGPSDEETEKIDSASEYEPSTRNKRRKPGRRSAPRSKKNTLPGSPLRKYVTSTSNQDEAAPRRSKRRKTSHASSEPEQEASGNGDAAVISLEDEAEPSNASPRDTPPAPAPAPEQAAVETAAELPTRPKTPKGRVLKLHANGKFVSSPVAKSSPLPEPHPELPEQGALPDDVEDTLNTKQDDTQQTSPIAQPPPRKILKLSFKGQSSSSPPLTSSALHSDEAKEEQGPQVHEEQPRPTHNTPPKKTLRINRKGKLLSSPPPTPADEAASKAQDTKSKPRRSRRKQNTNTTTQKPISRKVILKYGTDVSSKERLGQLINNILRGVERFPRTRKAPASVSGEPAEEKHEEPEQKQTQEPAKPQQPPKPTHPFFLPKQAQPAPAPAEAKPESAAKAEPTNIPKRNVFQTATPVHTSRASTPVNWPSFRTASPSSRAPDAGYPPWPAPDAVHVRGSYTAGLPELPQLAFRNKKDKGVTLNLSGEEDILSSTYTSLRPLLDDYDTLMKSVLRRPRMEQYVRRDLANTVRRRLKTDHPAVNSSRRAIKHACGAFEQNKCEEQLWASKYAPRSQYEFLQGEKNASILVDWLNKLVVSRVQKDTAKVKKPAASSGDSQKAEKARKKKKRKERDSFIVSDDESEGVEEDVLVPVDGTDESDSDLAVSATAASTKTVLRKNPHRTPPKNAMLITGPTGCGKTACVYAVAQELGFEVFELNAGSRRSAKDILERVGDMTQNHLVQLEKQLDKERQQSEGNEEDAAPADTRNQSTMASFFKASAPKKPVQKPKDETQQQEQDTSTKNSNGQKQKQSLILLDDADILFEEDRQFWSGVMTLLEHSKRPVIITAIDESVVPIDDLPLEGIVRMEPVQSDLAVDYLLTVAAREGHLLQHKDMDFLYTSLKNDFRASLMALNFWCQMTVGSERGGYDWPRDKDLVSGNFDNVKEKARIVSDGTYVKGMGMLSRDISVLAPNTETKKLELKRESLEQWCIGVMDWEAREAWTRQAEEQRAEPLEDASSATQVDDWTADMRSCLDIFCGQTLEDTLRPSLDASWPELPAKQRANYTESYPLIQADYRPEHHPLSVEIGSAFGVFLHEDKGQPKKEHEHGRKRAIEKHVINHIMGKVAAGADMKLDRRALCTVFRPLGLVSATAQPPHKITLTVDRELSVISEDVAPYARAIVAHDQEVEKRRNAVETGAKRRATRTSAAAYEGSSVAWSRKKTWLENRLHPATVAMTGGKGWQGAVDKYMDSLPPVEQPILTPRKTREAYPGGLTWEIRTPEHYKKGIYSS